MPTGYTPPSGEFATRSASGRCPSRLSTKKPRTFVIVPRFRKSAGFMSRSSAGAVDVGRGAAARGAAPWSLLPPPHAPTPAARTSANAMLAAQTVAPCLRSLLIVILHGPRRLSIRCPASAVWLPAPAELLATLLGQASRLGGLEERLAQGQAHQGSNGARGRRDRRRDLRRRRGRRGDRRLLVRHRLEPGGGLRRPTAPSSSSTPPAPAPWPSPAAPPQRRRTASKVAARAPFVLSGPAFLAYGWRSSTRRASGISRCSPSGSGTSAGVAPTSNPNTPLRTHSRPVWAL